MINWIKSLVMGNIARLNIFHESQNKLNFTDILSPLIANLIIFTITWIYSVIRSDITCVDYLWGVGFVVQSLFYLFKSFELKHFPIEKLTFSVLVIVHSLRLTGYLIIRSLNQPEDKRYAWMRSKIGTNFWWLSYFMIFLPQLMINMVIGMVIYSFNKSPLENINQMLYWNGILVMVCGSLFQSLADIQLYNFKNIKNNYGKIYDQGLWGLCRHPNYFGDFVFWWGAYICNVSAHIYQTFFSPLLFSFLVMFVTGVPVLESFMKQDHGVLYSDYKNRISAFFPMIFNRGHKATSTHDNPREPYQYNEKSRNQKKWKKEQFNQNKRRGQNKNYQIDKNDQSQFYKVYQNKSK